MPCRRHHLLAALALASGGCLVTSDSNEARTGKYVSENTLAQITPGETTDAWTLAMLGEPTRRTETDSGEVWAYEYTQTTTSSGTVLLLFAGSKERVTDEAVYIDFRDGVAHRKWRG